MVDAAVALINERIAADMGSLVEDRRREEKPRERVCLPSTLGGYHDPLSVKHADCVFCFSRENGPKKNCP